MTPDDGTTTGPPEVGEALIAALGFEPTSSVQKSLDTDGKDSGNGQGDARTVAADAAATRPATTPTQPDALADPAPQEWVAKPRTGSDSSAGSSDANVDSTETNSDAKPLPLLPDFLQTQDTGIDSSGPPTAPVPITDPDLSATTARLADLAVGEAPPSGSGTRSPGPGTRPSGPVAPSPGPDITAPGITMPGNPGAAAAASTTAPVESPPAEHDPLGFRPVVAETAPVAPPSPTAPPGPVVPSAPAQAPAVSPPPPYIGDVPGIAGTGLQATGGTVAAPRTSLAKSGAAVKAGEIASRVLDGGLVKRSHRVRARKVRRVVRHVDPWSVLTFSVLFHLCLYAALLLASVLVWNAAVAAGAIENIESFIQELGDYRTYEINGDVVFRAAMVIAGILTLASSVLVVLLTVIFNLISDLVGGIRMTVVEEETARVRRQPNQ